MTQLTFDRKFQLPLHFDSTMRSCFVSCPQKFWLEFVRGLRPKGISIDLHAGGCFALALEVVYKEIHYHHRDLPSALLVAHAAYLQEWGNFEIPEWKKTAKTLDRVWEAVEDYFSTYSPLTDPVQPYMTPDGRPTMEYTFAIPLEPCADKEQLGAWQGGKEPLCLPYPTHPSGVPWVYCGRFDMLGSLNGRPVVRDEKSTGASIGDRWAEQWDLRGQFLGYIWACRQCGLDLDTVIIRGIGIQKTQLRQIEAVKAYSLSLVDRWAEQLRRDLWRLRRSWDDGYFDYNFSDACTAYGSCVFNRVCSSENPESWINEFDVRHWNPIQKNPVKEAQEESK